MKPALLLAALMLAACGGDAPISSARAQARPELEESRIYCILRADVAGRWYIQNDADHMSVGVQPELEQTAEFVRVMFDRRYTHAVNVQVGSDDDFRGRVVGYSNLGVTSATITITAGGAKIDPARVGDYVPAGSGNLWVSVTMITQH